MDWSSTSAPCGNLVPIEVTGIIDKGKISLKINNIIKQCADISQMIWSVPEMISILSDYFELAAGDVIMSGTPAGVDSVQIGDVMLGFIEGLGELKIVVD